MSTSTLKYNIVSNDGEDTSVVAFAGSKQLIATKEHPNFSRIVSAFRDGSEMDDDQIIALFDVAAALSKKFQRLSERIMARNGMVYLDGVKVDNSLTQAIARYWVEGHDDLMPLVNFMEKIETNPNQHSKENLFGWLGQHGYQIAPDGDFIAYKGVNIGSGGSFVSSSSGHAIVNGEELNGRIPNQKDAIVEMPRTEVTHDPRIDCSTGLHAGNWRYARGFAQRTIKVKINPRDVVSVPTDSNGEKLRVCRYKVLGEVTAEDTSFLAVGEAVKSTAYVTRTVKTGDARIAAEERAEQAEAKAAEREARRAARAQKKGIPAKPAKAAAKKKKAPAPAKAAAKKAAPPPPERKYPSHYEKFTRDDFMSLDLDELKWLQGEWEITPARKTKPTIVSALLTEAIERLKTW